MKFLGLDYNTPYTKEKLSKANTVNEPQELEKEVDEYLEQLENAKVQDYREATIKYITFGTDPDLKQEQINYYINAINSVTS